MRDHCADPRAGGRRLAHGPGAPRRGPRRSRSSARRSTARGRRARARPARRRGSRWTSTCRTSTVTPRPSRSCSPARCRRHRQRVRARRGSAMYEGPAEWRGRGGREAGRSPQPHLPVPMAPHPGRGIQSPSRSLIYRSARFPHRARLFRRLEHDRRCAFHLVQLARSADDKTSPSAGRVPAVERRHHPCSGCYEPRRADVTQDELPAPDPDVGDVHIRRSQHLGDPRS